MIYACPQCKGELKLIPTSEQKRISEGLLPTNQAYYCANCNLEFQIYKKTGFEIPNFKLPELNRAVLDHEILADNYASDYDTKEFFENEVIRCFDEFERGIILPDIYDFYKKIGHRMLVLDIGCGTGRMLLPLSDYANIEVHGMDISPNMIDVAADKLYGRWSKINLLIGDCQYLPFKDNIFDVCLLNFGVLSFAPNHKKVVEDLSYVLKNNGIVWLSTYNKDGLNFYVSKYYIPSTVIEFEDETHIRVQNKKVYCKPFRIDELTRLLESSDFKVEYIYSSLNIATDSQRCSGKIS